MFRYKIKNRTQKDNLRIAVLLSFVAGMVNVAGFLAIKQLTTNVTGHFAFFVEEIYQLDAWRGSVYFMFVFSFFLGSFVSGILIEWMSRNNERFVFVIPVLIEAMVLIAVGLTQEELILRKAIWIAYGLLFAMGLQNALVTMISKAVVRTTHLTGLFTDLGIETAQLFFFKNPTHKRRLLSSIQLRFSIILFFLFGGVASGLFYGKYQLNILFFPAALLLLGLVYDQLLLRLKLLKRSLKNS